MTYEDPTVKAARLGEFDAVSEEEGETPMQSSPNSEIAVGDRLEVFDWYPRTQREKWQMATVTEISNGQIFYRLDIAPVLTAIPVDSKHWRRPR